MWQSGACVGRRSPGATCGRRRRQRWQPGCSIAGLHAIVAAQCALERTVNGWSRECGLPGTTHEAHASPGLLSAGRPPPGRIDSLASLPDRRATGSGRRRRSRLWNCSAGTLKGSQEPLPGDRLANASRPPPLPLGRAGGPCSGSPRVLGTAAVRRAQPGTPAAVRPPCMAPGACDQRGGALGGGLHLARAPAQLGELEGLCRWSSHNAVRGAPDLAYLNARPDLAPCTPAAAARRQLPTTTALAPPAACRHLERGRPRSL